MDIDILASGSSGNCCVINEEIAIDMGISMKKLRESGYVKTLKLLLLTHAHSDHFSAATVRTLHRERPTLRIGCCEWMIKPLLYAGIDRRVIDVIFTDTPSVIMPFLIYRNFATVIPEPLAHDVPNCGWHVSIGDEKIFYATDCATLEGIEAKNYTIYAIEANHTEADIASRIAEKQSRGEFAYEIRAAKYHMSHEQAMAWLAENAGENSRYILLHKHEQGGGKYDKTYKGK